MTFDIAGFHQAMIYGPGTTLDDIDVPPFPRSRTSSSTRTRGSSRRALRPVRWLPRPWTPDSDTFEEPGRYLVLCNVTPRRIREDVRLGERQVGAPDRGRRRGAPDRTHPRPAAHFVARIPTRRSRCSECATLDLLDMIGSMESYRTPDERFDDVPGVSPRATWNRTGCACYLHESSGDPVLLLHSEPTWAYLYRKLIPQLASVARSSRPATSASAARTSRRGSRNTPRLPYASIERSRARPAGGDGRCTGLGRSVGLRLAVEHPNRAARLVILNTGIGAGRAPSPEWQVP